MAGQIVNEPAAQATDAISVVIPTYARPERLLIAINSVLDQSSSPVEIIIADNDPAGSARQVCDEQASPLLVHVDASGIRGASHARNVGAQEAKGKWVAFLDDDDRWSTEYLEKTLERGRHKNVDMVLTPTMRDFSGEITPGKRPWEDVSFEQLLYNGNFGIVGSNIFIRTTVFRSIGGFDRLLPTSEDIDLFVRFDRGGFKYAVVPDPYVVQSIHSDQRLSETGSMLLYEGTKRLRDKYAQTVSKPTKRRLSARVHGRGFDAENGIVKKLGHAVTAALNGNSEPARQILRALKRALSIPRHS
jgi:glycosyltransferase involved in cell wall biosynthesis